MKKIFALLFLVIAVLILITFIIPSAKTYSYSLSVNCNKNIITRLMTDKKKWEQWWPGNKIDDQTYLFQNCEYQIEKLFFNNVVLNIKEGNDSAKGNLIVKEITPGSSTFEMAVTISANNPIKKIAHFFLGSVFKANAAELIKDLKSSFENETIIYGMKVQNEKVKDAALISTKQMFNHYPSTGEVYEMVNEIKKFIDSKRGQQSNAPMLNVHKESDNEFYAMVAIPIKEKMKSEGKFELKEMVLGNILTSEVRGGVYSIIKAENEFENYIFDHNIVSPAIPYQSLITDRLKEPDTSKWITRLYYPVY